MLLDWCKGYSKLQFSKRLYIIIIKGKYITLLMSLFLTATIFDMKMEKVDGLFSVRSVTREMSPSSDSIVMTMALSYVALHVYDL